MIQSQKTCTFKSMVNAAHKKGTYEARLGFVLQSNIYTHLYVYVRI